MQIRPLRTTVIGSYPFPSWLEYASQHLDAFGSAEIEEMVEDAVIAAVHDQVRAGLDVITDGEQTRLDFNLSFYGYIDGIAHEQKSPRIFGPPTMTSAGAIRSWVTCVRRAAWAWSLSSSVCKSWPPLGRRSKPACPARTR